VNWDAHRNTCATIDLYAEHTVSQGGSRRQAVNVHTMHHEATRAAPPFFPSSPPPLLVQWIVDVALWALSRYEKYAPSFIRRPLLAAGMAFALEYLQAEDLQTNYVDIGPVNKVGTWQGKAREAVGVHEPIAVRMYPPPNDSTPHTSDGRAGCFPPPAIMMNHNGTILRHAYDGRYQQLLLACTPGCGACNAPAHCNFLLRSSL